MVQTQFKTSIQVLRSGGKYVNHRLVTLFKTHGIIHQTSCPHSPQQNGVAERKNHHLLEVTRSLLIDQHVPHYLWGEALYSAVYLINRVPSRIVQFQTPLEALTSHHEVPSVLHIPPGCIAFFQNHAHQRSKLDPCALKCVFVGHSSSQKGYKSYHPPSLVCKFFSVDSLDETHTSGLDHSFEHLELDQGESFRGTLFHMLNKGK